MVTLGDIRQARERIRAGHHEMVADLPLGIRHPKGRILSAKRHQRRYVNGAQLAADKEVVQGPRPPKRRGRMLRRVSAERHV